MAKVRLSVMSLILITLMIITIFPVSAAETVGSLTPGLIATEPDVIVPADPETETSDAGPISALSTNNSGATTANGPLASPRPPGSNNKTQATATPAVGITENVIPQNQDTLHNQERQSSKNNPSFKTWLSQYTIQDFFALKDRFWAGIPFYAGFWALIFGLAVVFYLFKWKHLRQPLLFLSAIFFGFFLGGVPNPINGIFEVLANHQVLLNIGLILLPLGLSFIWGRFYCGWICPLGAIQEFLNPAPEGRSLPQPLDRVLKYLKYILLAVFGYLSWYSTHNLWLKYDPSQTLFTFNGSFTAIIILISILLISIWVSRPFCRYLCPLGAILAITSRLAPFKMRADAKKCMVCGKCRTGECPMDAVSAFNPEIDLPNIDNAECIKCSRCQKNCRNSALRVTGFQIDHIYSPNDKPTGNYD